MIYLVIFFIALAFRLAFWWLRLCLAVGLFALVIVSCGKIRVSGYTWYCLLRF